MALIICTECGREISDQARQCPHCGKPIGAPLTAVDAHPQRTGQKVMLAVVGLLVALLVAMFVSCPDEDAHRRELQKVGEKAVRMIAAEQGSGLVTGLSYLFGGRVVDMVVGSMLEVDSYGVVSVGRFVDPTHPDERHVVSVGAFGHVFTASADELKDWVEDKVAEKRDEFSGQMEESIRSGVNDVIEEAKQQLEEGVNDAVGALKEEISENLDEMLSPDAEE